MKIHNSILGTNPMFLHAQGVAHNTDQWFEVVNDVIPNQKKWAISFPDIWNITILTFVHGHMPTALDRQLIKAGIDFVNLSDYYKHSGEWNNQLKIKYTSKYLDKVTTDYVLILDGIDVLLADDLTGLLDRFKSMKCEILLGSSINCHPADIKTAEDPDAIWKYLNAGTVLGEVEALTVFYRALEEATITSKDTSVNNEQRIFKQVRKYFKSVKCDTGCKIFQTLSCCGYQYKNGIVNINSLNH